MAIHLAALYLLVLLLTSTQTTAEPYKGFSTYAALNKSFPCERFLQIAGAAKKPAMAVLWGTFGTNPFCVKRFIERFKTRNHLVEVHFSNETCRRNGRKCFREELSPTLSPKAYSAQLAKMEPSTRARIVRRVALIKRRIVTLGKKNTRFLLSTGLEDDYTPQAFRRIYKLLRKRWPYELVRSAGRLTSPPPHVTDLVELHAATSVFPDGVPCIWNQDGGAGGAPVARELFQKYSNCGVLFSWTFRGQGILSEVFVPPLQRTFEISNLDIVEHSKLMAPSTPRTQELTLEQPQLVVQ